MRPAVIPQTYEEWYHAITVIGKQVLTSKYIDQRIASLGATEDASTREFVKLYGEDQRIKTLKWFQQAKQKS